MDLGLAGHLRINGGHPSRGAFINGKRPLIRRDKGFSAG